MNHRQWKKNFKKSHGRNPSCWEDKKKKIRYDSQVIGDALTKIPELIAKTYGALFVGLSEVFGKVSDICKDIADGCMKLGDS